MGKLGKVIEALSYPTEVKAMIQLKFGGSVRPASKLGLEALALDKSLSDIDFCYEALQKVSRSFAVVIQQLPAELRDPVCIFYLVLRGLDSVEDDMDFDVTKKVELLRSFHEKLRDPSWAIEGVGDSADYRTLLKYFPRVTRCHLALDPRYRPVIEDITKRMGHGMAEFAVKTKSIDTVANYNLYCHYVAGLVGYGLSDLFSVSGLEDESLAKNKELSNSMGLFLQKTNIVRDYLEDLDAGRTWWPEEVWSKHAKSLDEFKHKPLAASSLACLNELVDDALSLAPASLRYLSMLKHPQIFQFCAVPQVMAMATLCEVHNNAKVFQGVVKVRKGLGAKMMMAVKDMPAAAHYFSMFAQKIRSKLPPKAERTEKYLRELEEITRSYNTPSERNLRVCHTVAWATLWVCIFYWLAFHVFPGWFNIPEAREYSRVDMFTWAAMLGSSGYLTGLFGTPYI